MYALCIYFCYTDTVHDRLSMILPESLNMSRTPAGISNFVLFEFKMNSYERVKCFLSTMTALMQALYKLSIAIECFFIAFQLSGLCWNTRKPIVQGYLMLRKKLPICFVLAACSTVIF